MYVSLTESSELISYIWTRKCLIQRAILKYKTTTMMDSRARVINFQTVSNEKEMVILLVPQGRVQ